MKIILRSLSFSLILLCFDFSPNYALEVDTHYAINEYISNGTVNGFSLNKYLKEQLGLKEGTQEQVEFGEIKKIWKWISDGGETEDKPPKTFRYVRSTNHFHDPISNKGFGGFVFGKILNGESSILWSQKAISTQSPGGHYSWFDTRDNFYNALISTSKSDRDRYYGETFRGLGQLMHLVQDISVPAHARNQFHVGYDYEGFILKYQKLYKGGFISLLAKPFSFDKNLLNTKSSLGPVPIANLFDTEKYTGTNPNPDDTLGNNIGLSEFTNANFFSDLTIFAKYPHPRKERTNALLVEQDAEDGNVDKSYYIKGYQSEKLALYSYFANVKTSDYDMPTSSTYTLDDAVYADYAQKLIPRAVGYSAGLLEYFFRGYLQVSALPIFYKNGIQYVRVKIKNMTPNETMENGYFVLTYRYTPTDGPPDGSKDKFGIARYNGDKTQAPCDKLESGKDMTIDFIIDPTIPIENLSSVKFTLAYRGTLGNEKKNEDGTGGAVIGKVFTLGEVRFSEEWDNGLPGKHPWMHTDFGTSHAYPGHGTTSNIVEGDTLIKDNIRFAGYNNASGNGSFIGVEPLYPGHEDIFPILITPKTSLQFKIDQMSINQIPPAPPGQTNHCQGLFLYFNNGFALQLTQDGQALYLGPKIAIWTFDLGLIFVNNIYQMFQDAGITPPEPLYLYKISFSQQLFELQDPYIAALQEPSTVEHHQHMEIDFISIVEEKEDEVKPQQ